MKKDADQFQIQSNRCSPVIKQAKSRASPDKSKRIKKELLQLEKYIRAVNKTSAGIARTAKAQRIISKRKMESASQKKAKLNKVSGESALVVGYHFPCLDGIYSMMNTFFACKLYNQLNSDLMHRLLHEDISSTYLSAAATQVESQITNKSTEAQVHKEPQITKNQNDVSEQTSCILQENNNQSIKKIEELQNCETIEEQKTEQVQIENDSVQNHSTRLNLPQNEIDQSRVNEIKQRLTLHSEELKGFLHSDSFPLIRFVPCKIQEDTENVCSQFLCFKQFDISSSVLIMLDYYGQSSENIEKLCAEYKQVIIIDHHKTFEMAVSQIIGEEVILEKRMLASGVKSSKFICASQLASLKAKLPNLCVIYDPEMSGASLSFDVFSSVLRFKEYLHTEVYTYLKETCGLVEIYDTKKIKCERAEAFCANMISNRYELNARQNPMIFSKLIDSYIEGNIMLGKRVLEAKAKLVAELMKQKFVVWIGGKSNTFAKCYAVMSSDRSIINETGNELAILSFKHRMDNMGCFIINDKKKPMGIKVSLRADNVPDKPANCHTVAMRFNGGGHTTASSFYTTFSSVKSWR